MKIIVDAMGGDNAPLEIVKGALAAAEEFQVGIVLVGKEDAILESVSALGRPGLPSGVEIVPAESVIEMEDDPSSAIRHKPDASMPVGLRLLRDGAGDAMVSAGSTGALLSGATLIVKRIRGIRRAALGPVCPTKTGHVMIVDCGANVECTPEYLLQFAYMGSFYMQKVMKIEKPRVGLLNIGAEETKGAALQKETYGLLRQAKAAGRVEFIGNVEARDVMEGVCDVLVCDGFSGNVLLKGMEGVGQFMLSGIKAIFMKNALSKAAALVVRKDVGAFKMKMDASEVGGTALLGIARPVIKAHGSSKAYAVRSAIRQAITTVKAGITEDIKANIAYMKMDQDDK